MLPSTQKRVFRHPQAEDHAQRTRDAHWRAEVQRLEDGGEAVAW
jgi:hypothetical protein